MTEHDDHSAVGLVEWLRNQHARHGEIEDKLAADMLERLTQPTGTLEQKDARAALAELVRLKDLKDLKGRVQFSWNDLPHGTFASREEFDAAEEDYVTSKPRAWEAARKALAAGPQTDVRRDAERWRAGKQICFPEFCGHTSDAPKGRGWYHDKLSPPLVDDYLWFDTADEAMDAAIKWVEENCAHASPGFVYLKKPEGA